MIKIILTLTGLYGLYLISCCLSGERKIIHTPNQDELSWQIYQISDTLKFVSSNEPHEYQAFTVKKIFLDTLVQPDKFRTGCDIHYLTRLEIGFTELPDSCSTCSPAHQITITKNQSGLYVQLYWMSLTGYSMQDKATDTLRLNGTLYQDVFCEKSDTTLQKPEVWRWYYSQHKGLLRYDTIQGKSWIRLNL